MCSHSKKLVTSNTEQYTLGQHILEHVIKGKDLGIIIDFELKFEDHITTKIKKANAMVGLIQ